MRSKEFAHDYRYFPDPDLLPLEFTQAYVDKIKATLPELPDDKKNRFMTDFGLSPYDAGVLVVEKETAAYFEDVAKGRDAKQAANWIITNLFAALNAKGVNVTASPVSAGNLGRLLDLMADGTISGRIAKDVFEEMVETGGDPVKIVADKGLTQITDTGEIEGIVDRIIADNPKQVDQYKGGNEKIAGWFVGQVMKATQGKANPQAVNDILKKKLGG
jgi:aspartyl-tRNA(Asn)/glutamyl-tRNA(Gln) amidotransferase subunit B